MEQQTNVLLFDTHTTSSSSNPALVVHQAAELGDQKSRMTNLDLLALNHEFLRIAATILSAARLAFTISHCDLGDEHNFD